MENKHYIELEGKILFDPKDMTNKHADQSKWKKVAIVVLEGNGYNGPSNGICDYYAWFIQKRFNLELHRPLRGAHVTFINDSLDRMTLHTETKEERITLWNEVKAKYNGKKVKIVIDLRPDFTKSGEVFGDTGHWWFVVPREHRDELHAIREELGFYDKKSDSCRPRWGLHMTIGHTLNTKGEVDSTGTAVNIQRMYVEHSDYIIDLIRKKFIIFED